ncbi:MAG: hypothetical protein WC827_02540 [Candidatus Paceibacterota bacterium]|jgi:hypothetical protein
MILNPNEKKDKIDILKDILYSKNEDKLLVKRRHVLKDKGDFYNTPTSWEEDKSTSMEIPYSKIFLGAFIFFIIAFGFAFYRFWGGSNIVSGDNIDILVSGPVSVSGGEEFSLDIEVKNNNNVDLQVVDLHVEYPDGTRNADDPSVELKRYSEGFGDIKVGESQNKIVRAILFGEENGQKIININVEYRISGSNAIFNKQKDYTILVSSSPVNIKVSSIDEANSNQQIDFKIDITSNSLITISGLILKVDYPFGFNIVSTSPVSTVKDNNVFNLGDLESGGKRVIKISGILQGQDGEQRSLKFTVGMPQKDDDKVIGTTFVSYTKDISLKRSLVGLAMSLNNDNNKETALENGNKVRADIVWENNLAEKIYNMVINIKINGVALDKGSINVEDGFYNSSENLIIFEKSYSPDFSVVNPSAGGTKRFEFSSLIPSAKPNISFSNSNINIETTVLGSRAGGSNSPIEVLFSDTKIIKISSSLRLLSKGYRSVGPFENTGPFPPKVDSESTYTITWTATDSFNNIKNAKASAFLSPNVVWTGRVYPDSEKIYYNNNTGEIIWDIGDMKNNTGDKNPARTVSFQISAIPSISQLGSELNLLNEATISGIDSYSGARIGEVRSAVTTRITSDPEYTKDAEKVLE